jgi:hypothetical protein
MAATDDDAIEEVVFPVLAEPTQGRLTPTPYSFEFSGEDALRLTVTTSLAAGRVAIHYRMHRAGTRPHAGRYTLALTVEYTATTAEFTIGEGYLLNVTAFVEGANPTVGQTFIKLEVIRGRGDAAIVLGTILQGYVTGRQDLAWPGSPIATSIDGGGAVRTFQGADPGAGNPFTVVVPVSARWELHSFAMFLSTSAVAGTRTPVLLASSLGITLWRSWSPGTVAAGGGNFFTWAQGMPHETLVGGLQPVAGVPTRYPLTQITTLTLTAQNFDAGDAFTQILYRVTEWLEVN